MIALFAAVVIAAAPLHLASSSFVAGARLPRAVLAVRCGGSARSPELHWSHVPVGTRSFALILHDPDAPLPGGFYHWVVYDLPAATRALPAGARLARAELGAGSSGRHGYVGPCPPPGPAHHYAFTLYALDLAHVRTTASMDARTLRRAIDGHVLASATLIGVAGTP